MLILNFQKNRDIKINNDFKKNTKELSDILYKKIEENLIIRKTSYTIFC